MDECCCSGEGEDCAEKCPECGAAGKAVSTLTLKQMVKPEFLELADKLGFRFCRTVSCDVVYFHADGERLTKGDVRVRVGLKEQGDTAVLCYCFGFTEGMAKEEIRETGRCSVAQKITDEVKAGHCACEVRNPQGSCCLGNVAAVVKKAMKAAPQPPVAIS